MKLHRFLLVLGATLLSQIAFSQYYYIIDEGNTPGELNQDRTLINPSFSVGGWTDLIGPNVSTPTWTSTQTIPFDFEFNGSAVTEYKVSSTGVLTFTTSAVDVPGTTPAALPNAAIPDNSVCIWGMVTDTEFGRISTKNFGTTGSQQHWIHFSSCSNGELPWSYWSIVLEEGTNNIYIADQYDWSTTGALSVGIQIDATEAYSDPRSPSVPTVANKSTTSEDDLYYTFIQGVQPINEVELVSLDLSPYVAPGDVAIMGTVKNKGVDPITKLTITWDDGTGPYVDDIIGLNILSNKTFDFTSPIKLKAVAGNDYIIDVNVNISGDSDDTNNDMSAPTFAIDFVPKKYVVGEEKTGTWCGWCPRGAVGLAEMESNSDFIGIAIHYNDLMDIPSYSGKITNYIPGGYPSGGADRVESGNLLPGADFNTLYDNRKDAVAPCDVRNIEAIYEPSSKNIVVSAESEWFGSITGDYRFSCVIVEDDVIDVGEDWLQVNYYADGKSGKMAFPEGINNGYDFSTGKDPEDPTEFGGYDHVARYLSNGDILGDEGSLPESLVEAGVHSYTFDPIPSALMDDLNKCHAVVMIVNSKTGEILNAYKSKLKGEGIGVKETVSELYLDLYPNPATDQVNISMRVQGESDVIITVTDVLGKTVVPARSESLKNGENNISINSSNLTDGFYFVNVIVDNKRVTKMLSIAR